MRQVIDAAEAARQILQAARNGLDIVSVAQVSGAQAGGRLLVSSDGTLLGSFGNAESDTRARELAEHVLTTRAPVLRGDFFAELHSAPEPLIIFGAGHIAVPLAELGVMLGFDVTILDDRDDFATAERFPATAHVQRLDYQQPLAGLAITPHAAVVLVTRAHKYDFDCLRALLASAVQPRYIGMIGSRRRVRAAFTALLDGGVPRAQLERVHAPVGIDIGAETPAEIAVSIAAQLVQVRHAGSGVSLSQHERVLDRFLPEPNA